MSRGSMMESTGTLLLLATKKVLATARQTWPQSGSDKELCGGILHYKEKKWNSVNFTP